MKWKDKPAALVGYGGSGARHAVRQLREILNAVDLRPLEDQVGINKIWEAFDEDGALRPELISGDMEALLEKLEASLVREPMGAPA